MYRNLSIFTTIALVAIFWMPTAEGAVACGPSTQTAPRAVDDIVDWPSGPLSIPVLQNDYDPDGTPLTIVSAASPAPAGQVTIAADRRSLTFTPSAGYSEAAFAYTIQDGAGETASATVYVRPSGPTASFTYNCNGGTDCSFTANPSTFENFSDFKWQFICPAGSSGCNSIVLQGRQWRTPFQQLITPGTWTVKLDVNYFTGKTASTQQAVNIASVTPYMRFVEAFETNAKDDLCIGIEITETNVPNPLEAEYRIYWDKLVTDEYEGLAHVSGPVGQKRFHCYSTPGVHRIRTWVRNQQGNIGWYDRDFELRNGAPEVLNFTVTQDPADPRQVTATVEPFEDSGIANITSRQWDTGDGGATTTTTGNTFTYYYRQPGTHDLTVKLTDKYGATGTAVRQVTIPNTAPQGYLSVLCSGLQCTITANAADDLEVRSYTWSVAGLTATTTSNQYAQTFTAAGRYPISVSISDGELSTVLKRVVEVRAPAALQQLAFYTIPPCRGYDSGTALTASTTPVTASLSSCIPTDAVAVELNAVAVTPSQPGDLVIWSSNESVPGTTNLNFEAGVTLANNAAVRVSSRSVKFRLSTAPAAGTARVILDVVGYYAPERTAVAPHTGPFAYRPFAEPFAGAGQFTSSANTTALQLGETGAGAAFFNLELLGSTTNGHLQAYATGSTVPTTSVLNYPATRAVYNGVLSKVAAGVTNGNVTVKYVPSSTGSSAQYFADGLGSFMPTASTNYRFESIAPCRLLDTRNAEYGQSRLAADLEYAIHAGGNCGIPKFPNEVLRVNVIAVNPSADGELVLKTGGLQTFEIPLLSFKSGKAIGNGTVVSLDWLGRDGTFYLKSTADTDVVVDVVGYFRLYPFLTLTPNGLTVRASTDGGWRYVMDYGDKLRGVEQSSPVCKTYDLAGTYAVSMTAWHKDDPNLQVVVNRSLTVTNAVPVPQFTLAQNRKVISFDATGSRDEPPPQEVPSPSSPNCDFVRTNSELNYSWDYGDGTIGTGIIAGHTYTTPGSRTITLSTTDRNGAKSVTTRTVVIPNDPPTARFTFTCAGLDCSFNAAESTDDGGIVSYNWTFGTATATTASPQKTYRFASAGKYTVTLVTNDGSLSSTASTAVANVTSTAAGPALSLFPISPCRIYDTRTTNSPLNGGVLTQIPITAAAGQSKCGIPATAKAVSVIFHIVDPTTAGHLRAWNGVSTLPSTSTLNFAVEQVVRANNAIVELSTAGKIGVHLTMSTSSASAHVVADVDGYYATDTTPATGAWGPYRYNAIYPCRMYDSRSGVALSNGETRYLRLDRSVCSVPSEAMALATDLHMLNSAAPGWARLFSSALSEPAEASTVDFRAATNVANGAVVQVGQRTNDDFALHYVTSTASTAHAVLDTAGYFASSGDGFHVVAPCRLLDTRAAEYGIGRLIFGQTISVQVQGNCGVPTGAKAVALNVTVVSPDGPGHLQMGRSDKPFPDPSILDFKSGDVAIGNGAIVQLSTLPRDLSILAVSGGTGTHLILDVVGYFGVDGTGASTDVEDR